MTANPSISVAHRARVEDSCDMVLLKLMYLNIYRDEKHHRIAVSLIHCADIDKKVYYVQFRNCDLYLDPSKKQVYSIHVVVLSLPKCQKFKICIAGRVLQYASKELVYFDSPEYVEDDSNSSKLWKNHKTLY